MSKSSDISSTTPRTEIWRGEQEIFKKGLEELSHVKTRYDSILDDNGPSIIINNNIILKVYSDIINRGCRIRLITEISAKNISYCKKLSKLLELRHFDGIKGNLGIIDESRYGASARSEEKKFPTEWIYSTVRSFVEQQQCFFDMLWNKSIPADVRIREIEEGIKPNVLETITDPIKIQIQYLDLLRSATTEIMLIVPTVNAISHQVKIKVSNLLKEKKEFENKKTTSIRILSPPTNPHYILKQQQKEQNILLSLYQSSLPNIEWRSIETESTTNSIILVIDRKESLVIEIKDDTKEEFVDSVGFATYSNSRATVLSYVSIFESFWNQSELVKKLKESEELQKDFVHIAAHELKNPVQPILALTEILVKKKPDENEFHNILKIIDRNAKKLIQLTNDILDVTKIETNNLTLDKESFNLNDLISDIVEDYKDQIKIKHIKLKHEIIYFDRNDNGKEDGDEKTKTEDKLPDYENKTKIAYIPADKTRISQVISNLLNNAIKFTEEGVIKILVEKKSDEQKVVVSIKDTGSGIDSSIVNHLFSKFVTKSKGGTGLGLYISKKIIEAHGGKLWAKNNEDGVGSTFSFSLPLI
ncbi:MAG: HAMP domain-containing sensor histidine kinase [Candidatus Nitrosocosmicus sp.]|jgi:signal transduction histidine kinase|nr:HAMP domain-containing histidine kinase [Candidatus Nitrosocosmicus sp.]